jgi:hypothetical protein
MNHKSELKTDLYPILIDSRISLDLWPSTLPLGTSDELFQFLLLQWVFHFRRHIYVYD